MYKSFKIVSLLFILVTSPLSVNGQKQNLFVAPVDTDSAIDRNFANHFVAWNESVPQKNLLFVFLPGTGGIPIVYREVTNTAANLGFHALSLTYTNNDAVNTLCALTLDLECYGRVRLEILDGTERTNLVDTNRTNSIENRLIKLLLYLQANSPVQNWVQFLIDGSEIDWTKIVIAGHSQGGGHAGIIGRYKPVKRVLMYAASDYNGILGMPAAWIGQPETTPNASSPDKFRSFSHQLDEAVNFQRLVSTIWPAYGIPAFGAFVDADNAEPPYSGTHSLTSGRACGNHHGCIAVDFRLVYENDVPVYKPVWEYLLSNIESTVSISALSFTRFGIAEPRPHVGSTTKRHKILISGAGFEKDTRVFVKGTEVNSRLISSGQIEASLPAGRVGAVGSVSVVVRAGNGSESNVIRY